MRFLKADNPNVALYLLPWFVPTNQNPLDMLTDLHERLTNKPEDTFCLIALKGRIVQAVLIAYRRKKDVFIWQAHARKGFKYSKMIFNGLIYWARGKGLRRIKANVSERRNREMYTRRYGFRCKRNKELYLNV